MSDFMEITSGLRFPEGPIAMPDGSVILVEMFGPRITRVQPDGTKETVTEIVGGPNGAAIGPDGSLYLCNNGGCFSPIEFGGLLLPGAFDPERYSGGRIQRVGRRHPPRREVRQQRRVVQPRRTGQDRVREEVAALLGFDEAGAEGVPEAESLVQSSERPIANDVNRPDLHPNSSDDRVYGYPIIDRRARRT